MSAKGNPSSSHRSVPVPVLRAPPLDVALVERGPGQTRVALLAEDQLWEVHHLRDSAVMPGDVILGRVRGKVPGGAAVFVDLGSGRDGFLAAEDCAPRDEQGQPPPLPPEGSAVLVEVSIAPRAEKGAKLTMALSLTPQGCPEVGLLVYTPLRRGVGLSGKITNKAERQRLQAWAAATVADSEGIVLRTRAWEATEAALTAALAAARREWQALQRWAVQAKPPCRLRAAVESEGGALGVALEGRGVRRVICAGTGAWESARAGRPDLVDGITRARTPGSLFTAEGLDEALEEALTPRVGALTIQQTAAVTAIDVDSGAASAEQTNAQAVMEIARQIRLRNLAGMIVIDFAAPRRGAEAHKRHLARALAEALADDPAGPSVLGVSALGLVEVRRPRRGPPLADLLAASGGQGEAQALPLSTEATALAALLAVISACERTPGLLPQLRVTSSVAEVLRGPLRGALAEAEQRLGDRLPLEECAAKPGGWWDICDRRREPFGR
jgi:ribonuclease G